jgi:hypothetical protein
MRVWVRTGDPATLRAHISQSLEVAARDYQIGVVEGLDAIVTSVREWVDAYLARARVVDAPVTRGRRLRDARTAPSPHRRGRPQ